MTPLMSLFGNREQADVVGGPLGRQKKIDAFVKWRGREKANGAREIAGDVGEGSAIDNRWSLQCTEVL